MLTNPGAKTLNFVPLSKHEEKHEENEYDICLAQNELHIENIIVVE